MHQSSQKLNTVEAFKLESERLAIEKNLNEFRTYPTKILSEMTKSKASSRPSQTQIVSLFIITGFVFSLVIAFIMNDFSKKIQI